MKLKLKGRHFEGNEEIQAESHDVMGMLMQNDFQRASDLGNPTGITVLTQKGTNLKETEENKHFNK
jgi:hypothetical protein